VSETRSLVDSLKAAAEKSARVRAARDSAPCEACLWTAMSAISNEEVPDEGDAMLLAREWLYDRERISACYEHEHLLD
jgi:hypothetical protein